MPTSPFARLSSRFRLRLVGLLGGVLAVCLIAAPSAAQSPGLQAPERIIASVGELIQFDLAATGLTQSAASGTRYDQLRFAVTFVGSTTLEATALDSTTGRFRTTIPCADAGRTLTLQFKLLNAGALLATATTEIQVNKDIPPISATYPEVLLISAEQPSTFSVLLQSVCESSARLEALPNTKGVIVTIGGGYPNFRVSINARSLKPGDKVDLPFRATDGGRLQRFNIEASVDNTQRPPAFERDLPKSIELYEDESRPIRVRAFDPNGETVRYTIKNLTDLRGQVSFSDATNGTLTWSSRPDALDPDKDRTEYPIIVEASDGKDAVTETFVVTVLRKVTIAQRQQRLRRYADEFRRLERLRDEATTFYRVVNRRADRRSNSELYRILAKSLFSILAAVSATIEHQQTRVIAVSSATVLVAGVDLVANRRRKYDPFEDLRAVRELVRNITVALSERKYGYNDLELGNLNLLAQNEEILKITRLLATDCDRFAIELNLLRDRYTSTETPFGLGR